MAAKISFTKHAEKKFIFLRELNIHISPNDIKDAINNPDLLKIDEIKRIKIALKKITPNLNIRVIFSDRNGIIQVITFYPATKRRYLKWKTINKSFTNQKTMS